MYLFDIKKKKKKKGFISYFDAILVLDKGRTIQLPNSQLSKFIFLGCNLKNANLQNTKLKNADFSNSDLTGADLTGADIEGARFTNAMIKDVKGIDPNSDQFKYAIKGAWSQKILQKQGDIGMNLN